MKSLKRILIIRYTLLIAAVLMAVALLSIIPLRSFTISQEKRRLEEEARLLAEEFKDYFANETPQSIIDSHLEDISGSLPLRITLIDTGGTVLGDSEAPASIMENHADRPEIATALQGRVSSSARESRTLGKEYVYAAAPIKVKGEVVGVARVSQAEEDVMPVVFQLWWIFLAAFGVMLLVAIGISIWTERTIMRSLKGIGEASADIAAGDLGRRVAEPKIEDFGDLARDFNSMAEQIRRMVEQAGEDMGKLEAILNNISAGIMVTDPDRRLMMLNPAAAAILGIQERDSQGSRVIEAFSNSELDEAVSRAAEGESVDTEIELLYPRTGYLRVKSSPVRGSEDQVVATVSVLEDVTVLKQIDLIRRDFVANVSHELRTPVATIKALTDALRSGGIEQRDRADRFLRDLDQETSRLSQLITDLLTLSKLEARETALKKERIPVFELFNECMDIKATLSREYGVEMKTELEDSEAEVLGDRQVLRTALNNLVDNAIKYNHRGGEVTLSHRREGPWDFLEVRDTGMGIPHDVQNRVFERFFRVDKDRSRETGGTGLGLSIVKHVAEQHGGEVTVRSVEGEGSAFTVRLPAERG